VAALVYGVTLTATAVFFNVIWFYASAGDRLLRDDHDPRTVKGITRSYLPGPWIFLAATLVAFVSPTGERRPVRRGRGVLRRGELVVRQVSTEGLSRVRYITSKAS
jgi:hypothetical protein